MHQQMCPWELTACWRRWRVSGCGLRRLRSPSKFHLRCPGRPLGMSLCGAGVRQRWTDPSRTASPNGRVALLPPRNKFHIVSANVCPWSSDEKPTDPVAPPRLIVTILPLAWHVLMSWPTEAQFGRLVPGNVALSVGLQV